MTPACMQAAEPCGVKNDDVEDREMERLCVCRFTAKTAMDGTGGVMVS